MLLRSIQKTANFLTQRVQYTERLPFSYTHYGMTIGGLSVHGMLCGYGSTSESYRIQKPTTFCGTTN